MGTVEGNVIRDVESIIATRQRAHPRPVGRVDLSDRVATLVSDPQVGAIEGDAVRIVKPVTSAGKDATGGGKSRGRCDKSGRHEGSAEKGTEAYSH